MKWSPDGNTLAVGSSDNCIYLHDVNNNYNVRSKCEKHQQPINRLDFTADGNYIRSCCSDELLYFKTSDGSHNASGGSQLKNTRWLTDTCCIGWGLQGVGDGVMSVAYDNNKDVVVVGDGVGSLKVFRFPVLSSDNNYNEAVGHSGSVTRARFTSNGQHLVTVGGRDKTILVWKLLE